MRGVKFCDYMKDFSSLSTARWRLACSPAASHRKKNKQNIRSHVPHGSHAEAFSIEIVARPLVLVRSNDFLSDVCLLLLCLSLLVLRVRACENA